jgi:hypothetical protein
MAVRDKRLMGGVPAHAHLAIFNTDATVPLRNVFNSIKSYAGGGKIHTLFILCHGYAGVNSREGMSMDAGGMGLELGKEGLLHSNVEQWRAVRDRIANIVVYACAAADTQPRNEFTAADGSYLMGSLALSTNADVYASNRIQWYWTYKDLRNGAFDFDTWEGQLLKFSAADGKGVPVASVPVELKKVLHEAP